METQASPRPQPVPPPLSPGRKPKKLKPIDRSQGLLVPLVIENLVPPDHKVRAIWALTGRLDLSRFLDRIVTTEGEVGRMAWNPRLLISIWIYAYSEQVSSARQIQRMMEYEPGLMWLAALGVVNHHSLSDFRVHYQAELDGLFAELLAVLEEAGFITLHTVMHDGTKVRAQAGVDTFRREKTLAERLQQARQFLAAMGDPREPEQEANARREAARKRAAREGVERLEQALEELEQVRAVKKTEEEKREARVSLTEPEARIMQHGDHALAPSYNVQISTDAEKKAIVGVHLTQSSSDSGALMPAVAVIEEKLGRCPQQMVADGGYTNQANIEATAERKIDLIGSLGDQEKRRAAALKAAGIDPAFGAHLFILQENGSLQCAAGKALQYVRQSRKRGRVYHQYQAQGSDCQQCRFQPHCCPKSPEKGRTVSVLVSEPESVAAFRLKMEGAEAKQIYKRRGEVAEFPNLWIKSKLGLRKFRLRGMVKAGIEALWACLTYNAMQLIRLEKARAVGLSAAA